MKKWCIVVNNLSSSHVSLVLACYQPTVVSLLLYATGDLTLRVFCVFCFFDGDRLIVYRIAEVR